MEKQAKSKLNVEDASYFVHQSKIQVIPYDKKNHPIYIMDKHQNLQEISESPLQILAHHLLTPIEKYHVCYVN